MTELKPCPFCGGCDIVVLPPTCTQTDDYNPLDRAFSIIRCQSCHAEITGKDWDETGKTAIAKWNARADDWQPIETAPMSNIRLLLYVPPYGVMTGNGTLDVNDVFFWKLHACLNKNAVPTHWKPLPAPPTLLKEESK